MSESKTLVDSEIILSDPRIGAAARALALRTSNVILSRGTLTSLINSLDDVRRDHEVGVEAIQRALEQHEPDLCIKDQNGRI